MLRHSCEEQVGGPSLTSFVSEKWKPKNREREREREREVTWTCFGTGFL